MNYLEKIHKESQKYYKDCKNLLNQNQDFLLQNVSVSREIRQLFAPIYVSNVCASDCGYCAFRKSNKELIRKTLSEDAIKVEMSFLKNQGYDQVYILSGSYPEGSLAKHTSMLGINALGVKHAISQGLFPVLESSPFSQQGFSELAKITNGVGRYVLFQETYIQEKYNELHGGDRYKGDPNARLQQIEFALNAGRSEVGIGILFGVSGEKNLRKDLACLIAHYNMLIQNQNLKKITISIPRVKPANNVNEADRAIDDQLFIKIVLTLKLLCPKAYLVITGRENEKMRNELFPYTDIIGSKGNTSPGGYTDADTTMKESGQFLLADRRSPNEIKEHLQSLGIQTSL